ncbi:uncharacterized protein LOC135397497 [Ornithodoros turicata]|uniref:uncharacterized protein LOC135397497 n=1 Tax=Ornithodoros turicata TaxID=34597 RepID=UPI0031398E31
MLNITRDRTSASIPQRDPNKWQKYRSNACMPLCACSTSTGLLQLAKEKTNGKRETTAHDGTSPKHDTNHRWIIEQKAASITTLPPPVSHMTPRREFAVPVWHCAYARKQPELRTCPVDRKTGAEVQLDPPARPVDAAMVSIDRSTTRKANEEQVQGKKGPQRKKKKKSRGK